jgi:DNA gyrase/topoisomerase IV subunit B
VSKKAKFYDENSIQSLSPLEFTRLRAGVYVGDTTYSTQLLIEIVSNAIDEYKAGHGDIIKVNIKKDGTIIVEDNGQGFLINSLRDDGKTVLEAAFSVLNTSGKYTDDGVYEGTALGLNGIGSKLATFLSHWLEVISYRNGKYEHIWFEEGIFKNREVGDWQNKTSGTLVQWKPSEEFFEHPEVDNKVITNLFAVLACLCPGLTIIYTVEKEDGETKQEFKSKNGLNDLVDMAVGNKEILKNRFSMNFENGKNKLDLVLTYTDAYSATIVPYVNTGLTDSGPHITQLKTILTREMNKFFREKGWLKDKDENLSGEDCQEGLYCGQGP